MLRGVSGGQKRRVTVGKMIDSADSFTTAVTHFNHSFTLDVTAEMLVAPRYAGFFDSISNGLGIVR
jgi:hypothetical protein